MGLCEDLFQLRRALFLIALMAPHTCLAQTSRQSFEAPHLAARLCMAGLERGELSLEALSQDAIELGPVIAAICEMVPAHTG